MHMARSPPKAQREKLRHVSVKYAIGGEK
jgi:hypothetical protein